MRIELNKSRVVFEPIGHTYTLDGKELQGITGLLGRQLFPDKYKSIPKHVLEKAAERGTMVHDTCELVDTLGVDSDLAEAVNYKKMCEGNGLKHEATEYMVSDEEHFASKIDKVFRVDDDTFDLADIKTTSHLDEEYVSWQLSIYAYLFEKNNPKANVRDLYGIWLRGDDYALVKVSRKPVEDVKKLLACEVSGDKFQVLERKDCELAITSDAQDEIVRLETTIAELKAKHEELCNGLLEMMRGYPKNSWKGDKVMLTRKEATSTQRFDSARFKKEHPDMYEDYIKVSQVKESLTIKVL